MAFGKESSFCLAFPCWSYLALSWTWSSLGGLFRGLTEDKRALSYPTRTPWGPAVGIKYPRMAPAGAQ